MSGIIDQNGNDVTGTATVGVRRVDTSRGTRNGVLNAQWASRPHDQRFTSLEALIEHVNRNHAARRDQILRTSALRVVASKDDPETLEIATANGSAATFTPTHWAFGQACSLAGAPASYLRKLPAFLAGVNLQYGLSASRDDVKVYFDAETSDLLAVTSPDYGRIPDVDIVRAVERLVSAQPWWKVPGIMDWRQSTYNPYVDVTRDTTTLFASDRDVFLFLCDDTHPIEIGKLANGDPDLIFRGFYVWNSEVGAKTCGIASFFLRAVCQNRNLWGVEEFREIKIRHTKHAPTRWASQALPALRSYAESSPRGLVTGIANAKAAVVARTEEDRVEFLEKTAGLSRKLAATILETHEREEGKPAASVWDFCQGITAVARTVANQDSRVELESLAGKLLRKASK